MVSILLTIFAFASGAQEEPSDKTAVDGVTLVNKLGNQIPILNNRFRIDHEIEEVTMLFFRKPGTPPVILVRPDGSKLYATMAVKGELEWFDDRTYDLIKLKNPMPGPWQAVGQLEAGSKILVLSELELHVEDLPPILIRGETIKITGHITNGGQKFKANALDDVLQLEVDFLSTNNADYANFGAEHVQLARFKDNGKGFDERPKDGVFTGEFKLDFPDGEWKPKYFISMPMYKRQIEKEPVIVNPVPFTQSVVTTNMPDDYHIVTLDITGDYVDRTSVIFQGKIHYPNSEVQSFSIVKEVEEARELKIINYDYGKYKVEMQGFGKTVNGREFMIQMPPFTFDISPDAAESSEEEIAEQVTEELSLENDLATEPEPKDPTGSIVIIIVGNLLLLAVGYVLVRIFVLKQPFNIKLPAMPNFKKKKADDKKEGENKKDTEKGEESDGDDDILDLSMPDD